MDTASSRWFSALNLAAYLTWAAVLLQTASGLGLPPASAAALLGLLALLLVAPLIALVTSIEASWLSLRGRQAACVAQAVLALLSIWLSGRFNPVVLLIVVAAQARFLWGWRGALLLLAVANATVCALLLSMLRDSAEAILELLPLLGFQGFALLMGHLVVSAEAARDALALRNAELQSTRQLLADSTRAEERLRLSRELHDVAGHKLTALKLNLRLLEREIGEREALQTCSQLADELLGDIRQVVGALRQHDGIDLAEALRQLVAVIPGVDWQLDLQAEARVERVSVAEVLLRAAQEAITNALRHGRAKRVSVRLWSDHGLRLEVSHPGQPTPTPVFGHGLTGMRERIEAIGGELQIQCPASGGLQLRVHLPETIDGEQ